MAFLNWENSFSVGVDSLDEQHKVLIEMINDFYENIKTRSNKENISLLLKKMKEYTILHFKTEEAYLKKINFPQTENHKKEHDKFIEKVADVEKKFNEGKMVLSVEITTFLKEWLKTHILIIDMKYANYKSKI
ncbi:MAG: hemerythrin family protein [Bacteroidales bacterium]|nr:hemerythrin family protein [Bacteroidales bacterium]